MTVTAGGDNDFDKKKGGDDDFDMTAAGGDDGFPMAKGPDDDFGLTEGGDDGFAKSADGADGFPKLTGADNDFDLIFGGDDGFPFVKGGDNDFDFRSENDCKTCGLIDFVRFDVVPGIAPNSWFLIVAGELPTISMQVELRPRIYAAQPEYWAIEVTGCLPPIVLPAKSVFAKVLSVTDTMGKKGLEVIGAKRKEIWQIPA